MQIAISRDIDAVNAGEGAVCTEFTGNHGGMAQVKGGATG